LWAGPVVDADIHANIPSPDAFFPYLEPVWRQVSRDRGWNGSGSVDITYPPALKVAARAEWRRDDQRPASSLSMLRRDILDPWDLHAGIVNCYYGIDSLRNPDWAAGVVRALNDWLLSEWLDQDSRLKGSIIVPARHPAQMVAEIERVGDHPSVVQVLMPVRSDRLYGDRTMFPVYEAMVSHGLVMGLHWGGTAEGPPSPTGWPSWYVEEYAAEQQVYMAQLTSLLAQGVTQAFPGLRITVLEGGFCWLPAFGWRLQKDWRALHREIPWLSNPIDLIRKHMRFSVAPTHAPDVDSLATILGWLGSEDLLLFASDYPHEHADDLAVLLEACSETMRPKVMAENACAWYGLDGARP
jgi:predicted TIM-barrel fold metal-dependent hydrolase